MFERSHAYDAVDRDLGRNEFASVVENDAVWSRRRSVVRCRSDVQPPNEANEEMPLLISVSKM
jgi:hypothetical protein